MFAIGLRGAFWRMACLLPVAMLILVAPVSAADPRIARGAAPAWVQWLAPPPVNPARLRSAEDGIYDLLYDTQTRITGPQEVTFRRQLTKVMERAGLEKAAQTQIDFDPAFQKLQVNRVAIWRDGKMIDRSSQAHIDILRREGSLDDGIMTGDRTAVVRLDDVQVGDVVDIGWTWQNVASPWPGQYFSEPTMGWSVPVGLTRFRLIAPATTKLTVRQSPDLPQPAISVANGLVERDWRAVDPEPIPSPKHVPAWSHVWPWLDISTMDGWASVADWATRHFSGDQHLPDAWARKLDAIAAASADPGKRAIAALRLVQDSIRYTSLSIGEGGFIPRAPAEVIRSGFGDCKDKSQLLAVTLRYLGIPAWPALTDMDEGPGLASVLPSAGAFDHAIVLARVGGRDRWFDATQSYQGGTMATLAALPYGYALPLRPGQAGLVAIPNPVPRTHTMTSVDTYSYVDGGLSLKTETIFSADEADIKRADIGTSGVAKIERNYLDYYRGMYPGVTATGHLVIRDDRDANTLVIRESYLLPKAAKNYAKTIANLQVVADTMRDLYGDIDDPEGRSAPIVMPWTIKRAHRIVFDMPGRAINLPDLEDSHGPAFDLTTHAWHDGDQAIMDFTLTGRAMVLPASAAVDYAAQAKALDDATNWNIDTTIPGLALVDASWLGLGVAILLVAALAGLALMGRRNRRRPPATSPGMETKPVIRHVPLTRRNAA